MNRLDISSRFIYVILFAGVNMIFLLILTGCISTADLQNGHMSSEDGDTPVVTLHNSVINSPVVEPSRLVDKINDIEIPQERGVVIGQLLNKIDMGPLPMVTLYLVPITGTQEFPMAILNRDINLKSQSDENGIFVFKNVISDTYIIVVGDGEGMGGMLQDNETGMTLLAHVQNQEISNLQQIMIDIP